LGVNYFALELDQIPEGDAIQSVLSSKIGQRTVPQVFVGGDLIGGCDDTHKANEDGVLGALLEILDLLPK
jgi:glutaredoxin 3